MLELKIYQCTLERNKPQLILANGSERGDFIPMDYVFSQFQRIHDGIQLMKTYYPDDPQWSPTCKISQVTARKGVEYAWDYEYEDYHPLDIDTENSVTAKQMEQIKFFGSDIHLTLTLDLSLQDEQLERIFKRLNRYGRVFVRINHESNGYWFRYNTQHTFREVNDFFVKCHRIIKNTTTNVYTLFSFSADGFHHLGVVRNEYLHIPEFREALTVADYWSIDKYASLNYGWPYTPLTPGAPGKYWTDTEERWWRDIEETYIKMAWNSGLPLKPLFINEFNSDSDVDGYDGQAEKIRNIYERLVRGDLEWIAGIVLYQFRDQGGLGLEKGDLKHYQQLPALTAYKNAISQFKYDFKIAEAEWGRSDYTFNWPNCDFIRGLTLKDITNRTKFTNLFPVPLFSFDEAQNTWTRLEVNESLPLEGRLELNLFVPPFTRKDGRLSFSFFFSDIKETLTRMLE